MKETAKNGRTSVHGLHQAASELESDNALSLVAGRHDDLVCVGVSLLSPSLMPCRHATLGRIRTGWVGEKVQGDMVSSLGLLRSLRIASRGEREIPIWV